MKASLVRRLAEIALGPMVVRRRLPSAGGGGEIFVSARVGGLKYIFRTASKWDPELVKVASVLVKKGHCVWDVGANVGLFSRVAAFRAGTNGVILSIEADLDAVSLLSRTIRHSLPSHAEIMVLPVVVSDSVGVIKFSIAKRARAANAILGYGSTQTGGIKEVRFLPCLTLDSLQQYFPPPDVLKIDVEGAERLVLKGGQKLLANMRPIVYCEVSANVREEITQLFTKHDYRLWDGNSFASTSDSPLQLATFNTVAIPTEKVRDYV